MTSRTALPSLGVRMAALSAVTTWVTLFAWSGFVAVPGSYLNPLVGGLALVAGAGVLSRFLRLPPVMVLAVQLLAVFLYANAAWGDALLPSTGSLDALGAAYDGAVTSAREYAAPVPTEAVPVTPLLITGGMLCGVLVDFFAATLRRVPIAGLPLLMIYSLPVSALDASVNWLVFCLSAVGFLAMLAVQEGERIGRWGRPLAVDPGDALGFRRATGTRHTMAIGASATVLAVFLPVLIPTLDLNAFDGGPGGLGGGDGRDVSITNPMTNLRRDLVLREDTPLMRVSTTEPNPEYIHISLLTVFTGQAWTPGGRDLDADQTAEGDFPPPIGMDDSVSRTTEDWRVEINDNFASLWLPTSEYVASVQAGDDWRYDSKTLDVFRARDGVDTSGMNYSLRSLIPTFDAQVLANAGTPPVDIAATYTDLPDQFPDSVRQLAEEVTANEPTDYQKAVALQQFFRRDGGFVYTTDPPPGNSAADLVSFLDKDGGREGYCEQFATAYAAMARSLDIPARVVVGFLGGDPVGSDVWEYSTHDLHAWPELYFEGSGWVKFEPTPSSRAPVVPPYTTGQLTDGENSAAPSVTNSPTNRLSNAPRPSESVGAAGANDSGRGSGGGVPWTTVLWSAGLLVLLVALALTPRTLRRAASARRWRGDSDLVEGAWAELRASTVDLGVEWPAGRSPRAVGALLRRQFGAPLGPDTPARPQTGAHTNPEAVAAIERLVGWLEEARYAPEVSRTPTVDELRATVTTCVDALRGGATRQARLRATWLPASVLSLRRSVVQLPVVTRVRSTQDVVDHVG
ncbi:transglutaminase domain-containing protein [Nocardioides guangzhouensis]|uniref:Transglutaminase domain-containing protein n=1 Tax=Nocardioides guangzhouensis TaxID=2497878 RepID=A0A4V1XYI3_9ACTN|nr:DUF3488 and transglutaminase-like domain-containing protein [Nocardioides guangzhouensis]RYP83349.1 transglutaminase domain-containing protein [Nocardioides guangzhouensis]